MRLLMINFTKLASLCIRSFATLLICSTFCPVFAQENVHPDFDHSHSRFGEILSEYVVVSGQRTSVKYQALKGSHEKLRLYLADVSLVSKADYETFSGEEKLAFLINAYNAFTLELITQHYPVQSIKDIGGWFSSPWKKDFFSLFGEKHTLDDIEHQMIRKWFDEPRIHFALVCAARSCPPLKDSPYLAPELDNQLSEAAKNFLSDSGRNRFDPQSQTLYLSSIFKWYGSDFDPKYGSAKEYVAQFFKIDHRTLSVSYLSYDWRLNDGS